MPNLWSFGTSLVWPSRFDLLARRNVSSAAAMRLMPRTAAQRYGLLIGGFASATALAAAMIPLVLSVLQKVETPGINIIGMTMVLQYVVSFGFILPVNAPR